MEADADGRYGYTDDDAELYRSLGIEGSATRTATIARPSLPDLPTLPTDSGPARFSVRPPSWLA